MNLHVKSHLAGAKQRAIGYASRLGVSLLTQAISSGTNFAMGIFLVRVLTPEGFGWHGIGIGLALLYLGVGNAMFLTQMIVLAPEVNDENRCKYYQDMFCLTSAFTATCIALSIPVITGLYIFGQLQPLYVSSIVFASACFLLNGFFIRHAYAIAQEKIALRINVVTSVCLALGMMLAYRLHGAMSPEISLGIYGLAQFIGALYGFADSGMRSAEFSNCAIAPLFSQTFLHGRWALAGVAITWLQSQSYVYVTGLLLGVPAVALLNAGRIIVSPFNLLLPALSNLIIPRLAEARLRGASDLTQKTTYFGVSLIGLGIVYLTIVMFLGHRIVPLVVGPAYEPQELLWISLGWCCVLVLQLRTSAASLGLQASLQFKSLSLLNGLTAAVTVTAALPLTKTYGPFGSIIAVGIGEALLGTALWARLRRMI